MVITTRSETQNRNNVTLAGSIISISSLGFSWLTVRPNRLAEGTSVYLWNNPVWMALLTLLLITCFTLSLLKAKKPYALMLGIISNSILIMIFILAGSSASSLINQSPALTRVSLGPGIIIAAAGAFILIVAARHQLTKYRLEFYLISWVWLPILLILLVMGWFNNLSVIQEYFNNSLRFHQELKTHIILFGGSILAGITIGIPLGIWALHSRKARAPIFFIASITQTIPSLALFGLLIAPLSALSAKFPVLQSIGIHGIGTAPAIIALIIYSLLPIVQNTYTGLNEINPVVTDAGLGMGMNRLQLLGRVQAPLAAPVILTGVRIAAVQAVGNTAVAALIGAGGLGQFVFQGLGQAASDLIILGAMPIILLALIIDILMQLVIRLATSRGVLEPAL
jgi:osmoprotectant transport system permease protein